MTESEHQIERRLKAFDTHWREIEPELKRIEAGRLGKVLGGGALFALGLSAFSSESRSSTVPSRWDGVLTQPNLPVARWA